MKRQVTKEEFYAHLDKYPRKLTKHTLTIMEPPAVVWSDFEGIEPGEWPKDVAFFYEDHLNDNERNYYILE